MRFKQTAKNALRIKSKDWYKKARYQVSRLRDSITPEPEVRRVFSEIYASGAWGKTGEKPISGRGSHDLNVISPYVETIKELSESEGFKGLAFVDLGCGDFNVGSQLAPLASSYHGIDIVDSVIQRNIADHGCDHVRFSCLNIIDDPLPTGNVCFIRQVLQHLSNAQIIKILNKLSSYEWVFLTEHHPLDAHLRKKNADKRAGADIRIHGDSGLFFDHEPFNLPSNCLTKVLEVDDGWRPGRYKGIIRSYLYKPGGIRSPG